MPLEKVSPTDTALAPEARHSRNYAFDSIARWSHLIAIVLAVFALVHFWTRPVPPVWWRVLIGFLFAVWIAHAAREAERRYGRSDPVATEYAMLALGGQLVFIGLIIHAFLS